MKYSLFVISLVLLSGACHQSNDNNPGTASNNTTATLHKPPSGFTDTVYIAYPAAVFYSPDTLQLEKLKAVTDTMIFESMQHDCFFQMRNARRVLKQYYPQVNPLEVSKARYLLFNKKDGSTTCIDLDAQNDPCGIFLSDGYKEPVLTDMTNIDTELNFYFHQ